MAPWAKAFAAMLDVPSSVPMAHMLEEENHLPHAVLGPPHMYQDTLMMSCLQQAK